MERPSVVHPGTGLPIHTPGGDNSDSFRHPGLGGRRRIHSDKSASPLIITVVINFPSASQTFI